MKFSLTIISPTSELPQGVARPTDTDTPSRPDIVTFWKSLLYWFPQDQILWPFESHCYIDSLKTRYCDLWKLLLYWLPEDQILWPFESHCYIDSLKTRYCDLWKSLLYWLPQDQILWPFESHCYIDSIKTRYCDPLKVIDGLSPSRIDIVTSWE